ncbi:MAG TPA: 50S ribosomal protein L24e [Nanoarchaeota archaeon]|nr:50S ribosomal protein L24e [Nanoarchaeota archaeon]
MSKCVFCTRELEKGTGKAYVHTDGKIVHFCSSKCERNMLKLKRKARNLKWATPKKKK